MSKPLVHPPSPNPNPQAPRSSISAGFFGARTGRVQGVATAAGSTQMGGPVTAQTAQTAARVAGAARCALWWCSVSWGWRWRCPGSGGGGLAGGLVRWRWRLRWQRCRDGGEGGTHAFFAGSRMATTPTFPCAEPLRDAASAGAELACFIEPAKN